LPALARALTLKKRRARAPCMGLSAGRTPFASGRSPNRHRCPEDSSNTTLDRVDLLQGQKPRIAADMLALQTTRANSRQNPTL